MGGRGGASGFPGGNFVTSITAADGTVIDLSGAPLQYGGADPNLPAAVRKSLEEFEDKRYKSKIEFSRFVDASGNVIEDNRGSRRSVSASHNARVTAAAMSHNHPRSGNEQGMLGGTFSRGDMRNFVKYNQTTYRATASEGTYSISKLSNFDRQGFIKHYSAATTALENNYQAAVKPAKTAYNDVLSKYNAGKVTYSDAMAAYNNLLKVQAKEFNRFLVESHNALLAAQKQYGYVYTLERRP